MAKPSFGKRETPLDYGALVKNLRDKGPEKLYLLWGEEDYLLADFVSRLRAACVGTEGGRVQRKAHRLSRACGERHRRSARRHAVFRRQDVRGAARI